MDSGLVPESKFDSVAYSNFVVDFAQVVPNYVFADSEFTRDFAIFESLGNQLDNAQLASAGFPCSVSIDQRFFMWQIPSPREDGGRA